jgi:hypothetical protein
MKGIASPGRLLGGIAVAEGRGRAGESCAFPVIVLVLVVVLRGRLVYRQERGRGRAGESCVFPVIVLVLVVVLRRRLFAVRSEDEDEHDDEHESDLGDLGSCVMG